MQRGKRAERAGKKEIGASKFNSRKIFQNKITRILSRACTRSREYSESRAVTSDGIVASDNSFSLFRFRLLQDVSNSTADVCDSSVGKRKLVVTWGQSVHLGCFVKMPEVLANQEVRWYHYSKEKGRYQIAYKYGAGGDKFIETSEKGLVIVGVNEQDAGRYDCWLGGALLCSYNITVDAHRCSAPAKSNDYQKIYSDWCHEFEKYKSAMKSWEKKQAVSRFVAPRSSSIPLLYL